MKPQKQFLKQVRESDGDNWCKRIEAPCFDSTVGDTLEIAALKRRVKELRKALVHVWSMVP